MGDSLRNYYRREPKNIIHESIVNKFVVENKKRLILNKNFTLFIVAYVPLKYYV